MLQALLQVRQHRAVEPELGPVWLLPVPTNDG